MYKLLSSCSKCALIALALVIQPMEAIAQKSKDDAVAEALSKAFETLADETFAMITATSVDLHCIGQGVHRFGLDGAYPRSFDITDKVVRFYKRPVPRESKIPESSQWTVVINGQNYLDWLLKSALDPLLEPRSGELNNVWINEREIGVDNRHRSTETNFRSSLDVKINRLTGGITLSQRRYSGSQLEGVEVFSGTCHKVTQRF
jgi:hypothetical protein